MTKGGRKLLDAFSEFVADRGAILVQWIGDAFAKIANLQFHELAADEIAFFLACALIIALAILKLARKPAPQK